MNLKKLNESVVFIHGMGKYSAVKMIKLIQEEFELYDANSIQVLLDDIHLGVYPEDCSIKLIEEITLYLFYKDEKEIYQSLIYDKQDELELIDNSDISVTTPTNLN